MREELLREWAGNSGRWAEVGGVGVVVRRALEDCCRRWVYCGAPADAARCWTNSSGVRPCVLGDWERGAMLGCHAMVRLPWFGWWPGW